MRLIPSFSTLTLCALAAATAAVAASTNYGRFEGDVVAKWDGSRKMTRVEPFTFIGPDSVRWEAPKGSVVDGASIPQFAWSIIGGPFEGEYRYASVIHDVACDAKRRPWQAVHEAFYFAMLAAGVAPAKAKVMYAAVYHFGPRWTRAVTLQDVPLLTAKSRGKTVAAAAGPDESTVVNIKPIQKDGPFCATCIEQPPGPPPTRADVEVIFTPANKRLTEAEFRRLRAEIEANDLSLGSIRNFK